jgi:hypothetical protein
LFSTLGAVWPPLVTLAFLTAALVLPSQAHELYRIMIQDDDGTRVVITLFFFAALSYVTSLMGHALIQTIRPNATTAGGFESFLARTLPDICGAMVPCVAGLGAFAAAKDVPKISATATAAARSASLTAINLLINQALAQAAHLRVAGWVLIGMAAFVFVVAMRLRRYSWPRAFAKAVSDHWLRVWIAGAASYCLLSLLFTFSKRAASSLGTLAVVCLFAVLLVTLLSAARVGTHLLGMPITLLGLLAAGIFSAFGWNDNHFVRETLLEHPEPIADFAGPQLSFEAWLGSRQDLGYYTERHQPYPVFIVAARGGGIYAASQEAIFLSRMQDQCPNFSQHLFAISGVSGGSVGAALFSSLARQFAQNRPWEPCNFDNPTTGVTESHAKSFLEEDFLAPIVAAALFPDLLQRFLPIPVGATDRGKALAKGMEQAWQNTQPGSENPFEEGFLNQWNAQSAAPALLFNTTEVGNGRRFVISPFPILPSIPPAASQTEWFYQTKETFPPSGERAKPVTHDLRLSEAAGVSARFPWLLPAAAIARDGKLVRLVDGGYHDNSGIETALNVIEVLTAIRPQHLGSQNYAASRFGFDVHLIVISGSEMEGIDPPDTWQGMDDVLAPIRALFSARDSISRMSNVHGQTAIRSSCAGRAKCPYQGDSYSPAAVLEDEDLPLALGFRMSRSSIELIGEEVGEADECCGIRGSYYEQEAESRDAKITPGQRRMVEYAHESSYTSCEVKFWLLGRSLPPETETLHPCAQPPAVPTLGQLHPNGKKSVGR